MPISSDDIIISRNEVTPELMAEIEKARQEYREGKCITLRTPEDVERYLGREGRRTLQR